MANKLVKGFRSVAFALCALPFAAVAEGDPDLPNGFVRLDWIKATGETGKQYIKTTYTPAATDKVVMKLEYADKTDSGKTTSALWSSRASQNLNTYTMFAVNGQKFRYDFNTTQTNVSDPKPEEGKTYTVVLDGNARKGYIQVGDGELTEVASLASNDFTPGSVVHLFCSQEGGSKPANFPNSKLIRFTAYDKCGNLLHDYVPACKQSLAPDDKKRYGVYDLVEWKFLPNSSSTAAFVPSDDTIPQVDPPPTVAYWRFDPDHPMRDDSGNGNNLVHSGDDHTDLIVEDGMVRYGANPACQLSTEEILPLATLTNLTVEGWFRRIPGGTHQPASEEFLFSNYYAKQPLSLKVSIVRPFKIRTYVSTQTSQGSDSYNTWVSSEDFAVEDFCWHHVAVTINSNSEANTVDVEFFLDGVSQGRTQKTNPASLAFRERKFIVGAADFHGDISDVRVTGEILTPEQFLPHPTIAPSDETGKSVWTDASVPEAGADVIVPAGSNVTLSATTPRFASLTVEGVLTCKGWNSAINADAVVVKNGGIITAKGPFYGSEENPSNRVWITCGTLDVEADGAINVSQRGFAGVVTAAYAAEFGFAGTRQTPGYLCGGPSHGGAGTFTYTYVGNLSSYEMRIYGSTEWPVTPGTGGYSARLSYEKTRFGGHGGGVVTIEATGTVTVNGRITADGESLIPAANSGHMEGNVTPGTGGSVCISCGKIAGSGLISAKGGWTEHTVNCNPAGGGRIALHYGSDQSVDDLTGLVLAAEGGVMMGSTYAGADSLATMEKHAGAGTIWMPDSRLITAESLSNFRGRLMNVDSLDFPGDLTIDHWVGIGVDGFTLHVGGNLTISGDEGRLELGVKDFSAHYARYGYLTSTSTWLKVDGSLTIADGGRLDVHAATTNAVNPHDEGAYVVVGGDLVVGATGKLYPFSSPANGASVDIRAQNVTIEEGGVVGLAGAGFAGGYNQNGYGPGKGDKTKYGAGYGGRGGNVATAEQTTYGQAYGKAERPAFAGSGGGCNYMFGGGCGGGFVHLVAADAIVVNGTICSDGTQPDGYNKGSEGGSGGAVLLDALSFSVGANAKITANGGAASTMQSFNSGCTAGGGGGRIAVWSGKEVWTPRMRKSRYTVSDVVPEEWAEVFSVAGGAQTVADDRHFAGEDGTIRFVTVNPPSGLMLWVR